jgi:hypothetical protein
MTHLRQVEGDGEVSYAGRLDMIDFNFFSRGAAIMRRPSSSQIILGSFILLVAFGMDRFFRAVIYVREVAARLKGL